MNQKCSICRKPIDMDCDWNQGRCPHRPALLEIKSNQTLLHFLLIPFIIVAWVIMHPGKVLEQAKKNWNIR